MKRLRHPVRAIREPFGTAGLIVACVALILALTGAAFAAAGLTGKQKKEVEKIAKKFAGKPGAPGAQGPAGSNGAAGAKGATGQQGPKGATGAQGSAGPKGEAGAAGKSPKVVEEGASLCEGKGGVVYEVAGSKEEAEICNGKEGQDGQPGSPWAVGGTLPPGATETGYWSFNAPPGKITVDVEGATKEIVLAAEKVGAPISFPIAFPFELAAAHTHFLSSELAFLLNEGLIHGNSGEVCAGKAGTELTDCEAEQTALQSDCPGGTFLAPKAKPGELCVYAQKFTAESPAITKGLGGNSGARTTGAIVQFAPTAEATEGWGAFAVTGCEEEPGTKECKPGS